MCITQTCGGSDLDFTSSLSNCSVVEDAFRPHGLVPAGVTDFGIPASTSRGSTKSQVLHVTFLSELPRRSAGLLLGLHLMDCKSQISVEKTASGASFFLCLVSEP